MSWDCGIRDSSLPSGQRESTCAQWRATSSELRARAGLRWGCEFLGESFEPMANALELLGQLVVERRFIE